MFDFKKKFCKYVIQNTLKQYIEGEIETDSLTIELSKGLCTVCDLNLKLTTINDLLETSSIPFELVEGKVKQIKLSIPWADIFNSKNDLLKENFGAEINGLNLVLQLKKVISSPKNLTSSICKPLSAMTASMEFTRKHFEIQNLDDKEVSKYNSLEGFSENIMDLLSRCHIKISNLNIKLQVQNNEKRSCSGINFFFPTIKFFDEILMNGKDCESSEESCNTSFGVEFKGCKHIEIDGCLVFMELQEKQLSKSHDSDEFHDAFEELNSFTASQENKNRVIEIARFHDRQEAKVSFKSNKNSDHLNVSAEVYFGSCCSILSPYYLEKLLEFTSSVTSFDTEQTQVDSINDQCLSDLNLCKNKLINPLDFKNIQNDFLFHKNNFENKRDTTFLDFDSNSISENKFYSLVTEDSVEYNTKSSMNKSYDSKSEKSFCTMMSSQMSLNAVTCDHNDPSFLQNTDTSLKVHVKLTNFAFIVLHSNPDDIEEQIKKNKLQFESFPTLTSNFLTKSKDVFRNKLYNNKEVQEQQVKLSELCNGFDNLCLTINSFSCNLISKSSHSSQEYSTTKINISCFNANLIECINLKNCFNLCKDSFDHENSLYTFSPLFKFKETTEDNPNFRLELYTVKRYNESKITLTSQISDFLSELDLTIINRLKYFFLIDFNKFQSSTSNEISNNEVVNITLTLTFSEVDVRFLIPIADLRPEKEQSPYYVRYVRDEYLQLLLKDLMVCTSSPSKNVNTEYLFNEVTLKSKDIKLSYANKLNNTLKVVVHIFQSNDVNLDFDSKPLSTVPQITFTTNCKNNDSILLIPVKKDEEDQYVEIDRAPSPFENSKNKYFLSNTDYHNVTKPCKTHEMKNFYDEAMSTSNFVIDVQFSNVVLLLHSKEFYESLYNRICYDLLLWKPLGFENKTSKSIIETESSGNVLHNLNLSSQKLLHENKHPNTLNSAVETSEIKNNFEQNAFSLNLKLGKTKLIFFSSLIEQKKIQTHKDELCLCLDNTFIYYISGYKSDPLLDYISLQAKSFKLYHIKMSTDDVLQEDPLISDKKPVIAPKSSCLSNDFNMLSVSFKLTSEKNGLLQTCLIAASLEEALYEIWFELLDYTWIDHISDFFTIKDQEVLGYTPPSIMTVTNVSLKNCYIQYIPKKLETTKHVLFELKEFSLSSNVVAESPLFRIQLQLENGALYLSKVHKVSKYMFFILL